MKTVGKLKNLKNFSTLKIPPISEERQLEPCFDGSSSHTPVYYQNPNDTRNHFGTGRHEEMPEFTDSDCEAHSFTIEDEETDDLPSSLPPKSYQKPLKKQLQSIDSFTV